MNPCLIAKLILLKHYQNVEGENEKINVKKYLRDTTLIKDMDLSYEVYLVSCLVWKFMFLREIEMNLILPQLIKIFTNLGNKNIS